MTSAQLSAVPRDLDSASQVSVTTRRAAAVAQFIATARQLIGDPAQARREDLESVSRHLEVLGRQTALFPEADFPVDEQSPAVVYRLGEDTDGSFALYLSAGLPGKSVQPHDHTTWAMITGVQGVERNVFYRREKTADPARDTLTPERTVDVIVGNSVILGPDDVHTIELQGQQTGLHLHFYGRGLDHMPARVVFETREGGSYRTFGPPAGIRHARISAQALKAALADGEEIAVLDIRDAGVYARRHLLFAVSAPRWHLPLAIERLVPRRTTRIVVVDGDESQAHDGAHQLIRLGWTNVSVLAGGTAAWAAAGLEVFSGTNVPSKAFGEVIEHEKKTPWITSDELERLVQQGEDIAVVDSRTPEEFAAFSLPFAHSVPGAELVYRVGEIAPDPDTLVVVNCAGRTRSIVGAQTLIDAGIPNRVVSLRNGTMDWLLTGRSLAHGRQTTLPEPSESSKASARAQAEAVAQRAGVRRIDTATLRRWQDSARQQQRTLYLFDIRSRAEYEAGHLEGWRWAPGGQLVQTTDEYAATRHARIVLADWDGVRALTTGAWLAQLGWDVSVYAPATHGPEATRVTGPEPVHVLLPDQPAPLIAAPQAANLQQSGAAVLIDIDSRAAYEKQHPAEARFVAPGRLVEFIATLPAEISVVLVSADGVLAASVAAGLLRSAKPVQPLLTLRGGTQAWIAAELPTGSGSEGVVTDDDDQSYSPYLHHDLSLRNAGFVDYLEWELGLVAQLEREGHTGISLID
ncbi:rhodanese-related sulfurtransferase/predicted metal-dependent enzyme (double-stranded beta helix superfamily) [Herbaspirillum rubrisubalbicans]|uniref:rhodanese-like domain-containing protein n=1 Tax=Herbaspirillum rubrisubalbicans TaxID=80842 RepID=UPI0020A128B4|nr:rhodanese-like domain-containing protein [Herbaspirillum rubrisubalbicans]MCP1572473.1 rhodanese-related sulfurtransferase/predicted metal-dependent enzyme (double-stranded beta helix superfamily) [Herbaspirillum rubrisubalbicans]